MVSKMLPILIVSGMTHSIDGFAQVAGKCELHPACCETMAAAKALYAGSNSRLQSVKIQFWMDASTLWSERERGAADGSRSPWFPRETTRISTFSRCVQGPMIACLLLRERAKSMEF